ncbi:MAG: hypothetical protein H6599_09920 [Flavobacteriales bacterium]|nr:hypothetical protein [Flavobacteriales bacterium]
MKSYLIYILLFLFLAAEGYHSQLVDNMECQAFGEEPFFDETFVRQNGIHVINGEIKTKGNLEVIKDPKLVSRYEFDSTGRLKMQYTSFNGGGNKDTTFINYIYDDAGNIITKRTNDAYGFFSYNYEYDEENRPILKTYCREENEGPSRYHFVLGKQYTIVKESYSYTKKDSVLIKSIYNNHNRIYQTDRYIYNNLDLLVRIESQYIINKKKAITEFTYTDIGKVASKIHYKDYNKKEDFEKWEYQYDELGNLSFIDYYKGEEHITHKEVLYDKSTFTLKALLVQDVASNFITIIKYSTSFFN